MTCRKIRRLIPLHVGGDLALGETAAVRHHLAECSTCTDLAHSHEDARAGFAEFSTPLADANSHNLWENIEPRLDALDATMRLSRPRRKRVLFGAGFLAVAASLSVLLPMFFAPEAVTPSVKGKEVAYGNQVPTLLPIAVASVIHAESRLGPRELGSLIPTEHSTAEALGIVIQAALEEASGADSQSDALLVGHPRR